MLQAAGHLGLRAAASASSPFHLDRDACPCMGCRTNLKKEKRQRNRINAFRFKKGGFTKRRFNGPDYAAEQKKADEDNKFFSLVRDGRARLPVPLRTTHDPDARASCLARSSTRILRRRPPLPLLRPPTRRRKWPRERTTVDAVRAPVWRA